MTRSLPLPADSTGENCYASLRLMVGCMTGVPPTGGNLVNAEYRCLQCSGFPPSPGAILSALLNT